MHRFLRAVATLALSRLVVLQVASRAPARKPVRTRTAAFLFTPDLVVRA